jgi:hypothetical protein
MRMAWWRSKSAYPSPAKMGEGFGRHTPRQLMREQDVGELHLTIGDVGIEPVEQVKVIPVHACAPMMRERRYGDHVHSAWRRGRNLQGAASVHGCRA